MDHSILCRTSKSVLRLRAEPPANKIMLYQFPSKPFSAAGTYWDPCPFAPWSRWLGGRSSSVAARSFIRRTEISRVEIKQTKSGACQWGAIWSNPGKHAAHPVSSARLSVHPVPRKLLDGKPKQGNPFPCLYFARPLRWYQILKRKR